MSETKLHLNSNNLSKNVPVFLVFGIIYFILLEDAFIQSNFELHFANMLNLCKPNPLPWHC